MNPIKHLIQSIANCVSKLQASMNLIIPFPQSAINFQQHLWNIFLNYFENTYLSFSTCILRSIMIYQKQQDWQKIPRRHYEVFCLGLLELDDLTGHECAIAGWWDIWILGSAFALLSFLPLINTAVQCSLGHFAFRDRERCRWSPMLPSFMMITTMQTMTMIAIIVFMISIMQIRKMIAIIGGVGTLLVSSSQTWYLSQASQAALV